ncbi:PP2C family protein-serine/threonine phosphatase [Streptomyces stelliscabiei]|uniref:PP2C family protein-serine/threonine phosphatase n=1 Tax=Streptomyces stelliscabiei TaxID=146820 RepID=UPI002FF42D83
MRNDAEALVRRLTLLSETIVDVPGRPHPRRTRRGRREGAARLTRLPAAVFVLGEDGHLYSGTSRARARTTLPDGGAHEAVARLIRRVTDGAPGPPTPWSPHPCGPAGFFRPGVTEDARLVLARTESGTPVCVATPVRGTPGTAAGTTGLVGRLAQATALAAQPLLMYQSSAMSRSPSSTASCPSGYPSSPASTWSCGTCPRPTRPRSGGDFYAALSTSGGVLTAVGDVVGHSLDAATVMVEIRHALRPYCVEESDPAALARRLDRMLQHYHPDVTATVCLALVEPDTGRVRVAKRGSHPAADRPRLRRGRVREGRRAAPRARTRPAPAHGDDAVAGRSVCSWSPTGSSRPGASISRSPWSSCGPPRPDAPDGTVALCDTLLHCFGRDREDDIALLALRLRLG